MKWLNIFIARVRGLFLRDRVLTDIDDEMRSHIEMETESLIERGMNPDEARSAAEKSFGNIGSFKDQGYDIRGGGILEALWQDFRYGFRLLRKNPGFATIAVLTLALGIGINAAIFSVVDGVLLRPLPYQDPDRLVRIWSGNQKNSQRYLESSYEEFQQFKQYSQAFVAMATFSEARRILRDKYSVPRHINVARISDRFFSVFGVSPAFGRNFLPEEFKNGLSSVILSHRIWQSRYAANPTINGNTIMIDGVAHTVVGVMPEDFNYPQSADMWRPLTSEETEEGDPEFLIIAKLASGVTLDQADVEVSTIAKRIADASGQPSHRTAWVQSMQAMLVRDVRTPLLVLLGAVTMILLIACANVANLLLARGVARQKEIAIRTALGAGRMRIIRQLFTECILIAALGGAAGLLLCRWAIQAIVLLSPDTIPRLNEVALDERVIGVMTAVITIAAFVFGLIPAFQNSRSNLNEGFKKGSHRATANISRHRLQKSLVIVEVALATVLVISAGLLIKSFRNLISLDRGFNAENVLVVSLTLRGQAIPQFATFYEQALEMVSTLPDIQSASLALRTPMESHGFQFSFQIEGDSSPPLQAVIRPITSEYFKTVGIPLLSGRQFNDQDQAGRPIVAIINETLAKNIFSYRQPIGQRLKSELIDGESILIVGVADDVVPEAGEVSKPAIYFPFAQLPVADMSLLLRTTNNPLKLVPAVRERIWALNPNVPLDNIYTLEQKLSETITSPRLTMLLVGVFAALGMILAAVGVYGVISFGVNQRTKEIGIRRALGAQETTIVLSVLKHGITLTIVGLIIGLMIAAWATSVLSTLLFQVSTTDPILFAAVCLILMVTALLACYFPARRATRINSLEALRHE